MNKVIRPYIETAVDDTLQDMEGIFPNALEVHKFIDSFNKHMKTGIVEFRWMVHSKCKNMDAVYQEVLKRMNVISSQNPDASCAFNVEKASQFGKLNLSERIINSSLLEST